MQPAAVVDPPAFCVADQVIGNNLQVPTLSDKRSRRFLRSDRPAIGNQHRKCAMQASKSSVRHRTAVASSVSKSAMNTAMHDLRHRSSRNASSTSRTERPRARSSMARSSRACVCPSGVRGSPSDTAPAPPRARNSPGRPRPSRPAGDDKRPSITGLRHGKIYMKSWEVRHAGMGRGRLSGFSRCLHFAT